MNFFRRNISGGGGGHSNNAGGGGTGGGGSADNILSTSSKHQDFYIQNKFGSNSFSPNTMTSSFVPSIWQRDQDIAPAIPMAYHHLKIQQYLLKLQTSSWLLIDLQDKVGLN